jgi:hypothetical protein
MRRVLRRLSQLFYLLRFACVCLLLLHSTMLAWFGRRAPAAKALALSARALHATPVRRLDKDTSSEVLRKTR